MRFSLRQSSASFKQNRPLSNLSFIQSTVSFVLLENETHVPFQSPFPLSKTLSSSSSFFLTFSVPSLISYIRYVLPRTKHIRSLSIFSPRLASSLFTRYSLAPFAFVVLLPIKRLFIPLALSRPSSVCVWRCILFLLSPFTSEPSFTHAHRGRDHVFYTRVRVRAFARAHVCMC